MKSLDITKSQFKANLADALTKENPDGLVDVFVAYADEIQKGFLEDIQTYKDTHDAEILSKRGIRTLTAKEEKFYNALIKSYETKDIKKAFDGLENDFPDTVINTILEDIKSSFPLLGAINIRNTATVTKFLVNKKGVQLAVWGPLGSKITEELEGAIDTVDLTFNKLTAFMPIAKDMLNVGPTWVDAYIRAVLTEATGAALCKAIVDGNGKYGPIGMTKDVSASAAVQDGVYPDKTVVTITDFSPLTMGSVAKTIAQGPNGRSRPVPELLMVVNPVDYFEKVMPAVTFLTPNGTYVTNVLPYPTRIVQDENVPSQKVIFGLASKYFLGIGKGGAGGTIEYSDEFRWLDDERVYTTRLYGNGMPLDENAFVVANISGLKPMNLEVAVKEMGGTSTARSRNVTV